ncbi:hypothetical protein FB567DRAFT_603567 [Paraphoma chrysanthemicola]|uniref:Protein kinase domain-containing protein n=1 Tax=Paraphoma chrysanthemicola TaxID=798071 RepID=A0A8K0VXV7_9PLEO|nr:hypothetical protein FB567DRAFT_603567 [Paraphoma chrysanthemicola]
MDIQEQSHVEMLLTEGQQQELDNLHASASLQIIRSQAQPYTSSTKTSATIAHLHDMGCARYTEQEIHLLATLEPPTRYLSSVNGSLMEETKCTRNPLEQDFVYDVQAFHCLRHVPGVLDFGGAVLDRSGKHLHGYLLKLPQTRCTLLLDRLSETGCTRWEDVEIWCRKLVEVVRQVHSMNFVVGSLRRYRVPILVDSYDELYLWRLEATPSFGGLHEVIHPPEFIKFHGLLDRSTPRLQIPRNTHKLDIYMLGMLLWVFAQSWAEQCTATSKRRIVQLPPMDAKVPLYF